MIEELLSSVMWVVHCVMMCDYGPCVYGGIVDKQIFSIHNALNI